MQLTSSLAAAAVVATAMASSLPSNYTFASTALSAPAKTATSTGAVVLSTGAATSGTPVAPAKVKELVALSANFEFEIIAGVCLIKNMPAAATSVSWRLVVDLDLGGQYYFEVCEADQNMSVVTKVRGEYYFGQAVYYEQTTEGSYDLVCQAQGSVLTQYKVEASAVVKVEVKAEIKAKIETKIVKCENTQVCKPVVCGEECAVNVVAKVQPPAVHANTTAPAPAPVKYVKEKCEAVVKEECNCVKTCIGDECVVKKPAAGPAPPALPADKVSTIPAPAPAPVAPAAKPAADKEQHQPQKPAVAPPAAAANTTGNAKPAAQLGGAGRVVATFNVLAGVVAVALFL